MMKSYGLFGFLGFISLSVVFALPARAEDTPRVFISEINWAGSELSTADEWIELINLGQTPVDLSHYVLTGAASSGGAIALAEGTVLEPGSTLVIANYALGDPKTSLLISPNLVTTAFSLPNSALDILLTTPAGLVIDNYTDVGTPDFGLTNPSTSIERNLTTFEWQSSTQNLNLSSTSQLATPGAVSLPAVVNGSESAEVENVVSESSATTQVETLADPEPSPEVIEPNPEPVSTPVPISNTEVVPECPSESISAIIEGDVGAPLETWPSLVAPEPVVEAIVDENQTESTESNTLSVQKIDPGEIVINELVSDPLDGIEWVEILNTTGRSIDLSGSRLEDAGAHTTPLPADILAAGAMLVIENPNGNLNNAGDTLTLFDASNNPLDTLIYGTTEIPAPQDGESLARNSDGDWVITSATRNLANTFPTLIEESETSDTQSTQVYETFTNEPSTPIVDSGTPPGPVATTNDTGTSATEPVHRIVAIAKSITESEASSSSSSTRKQVKADTVITGTVVALPDTFAKQIMFLDGYEIYFHAADWPELALGDIVQVTGTETTSNNIPRLKISSADAIVITGTNNVPPVPVDGSELATTRHGALISIAGRVTDRSGNELSITTEDGTHVIASAIKKTGVSWSALQTGSIIVIGIAKHTDDGVVIAPRSMNDIHFTPDAAPTPSSQPKTKTNTTPLVGGGLLTGSVGALGTWYLRSRKGLLSWLPF